MAFLEPGTPAAGADAVRELFRATYEGSAGVVARAPGRVNLIGEHTDYNGGLCLPLALGHATFAAVSLRGDEVVRVSSRQEPGVVEAALDEVGPGAVPGWAAYVVGVPWALREDGLDVPGLDVAIDSTVPIGSGLSSSAALECAVAVTVASLLGVPLDVSGRRRLAAACVRAEREFAGAPTGGMDQTIALLASPGSALLIDFADDSTTPVELALGKAGLALLVTDTKVSHALVDGGYGARRADCDAAAAELGVATLRAAALVEVEELADDRLRRRARHVVSEIARVDAVVSAVRAGDWDEVGRIFLDSHVSMRDDFEISCPELDTAVTTAVEAGALGARMTGGGFGGSSIALVPSERVDAVARAVDAAFVAGGYRSPAHLLAEAAGAADVVNKP